MKGLLSALKQKFGQLQKKPLRLKILFYTTYTKMNQISGEHQK